MPVIQSISDNHRADLKKESDYKLLSTTCAPLALEKNIWTQGDARSPTRLSAVNHFFKILVVAPCTRDESGAIYRNPFKGIRLNTLSIQSSTGFDSTLLYGALYDLDYGLDVFRADGTTLCNDGWISSSRGRGTCSHHGGYARSRGAVIDYQTGLLIPNPFPVTANSTGISFNLITTPISVLWRAIFDHLLHKPKLPLSILGFLIFLLVATWPIVLFATLVHRVGVSEREKAAAIKADLINNPFSEIGGKSSESVKEPQEIIKKRAPKRPSKLKYTIPTSPFENYMMVAWLNSPEVEASASAVRNGVDEEIYDDHGQSVGWVRVRIRDEEDLGNLDFGIERHRNGAINMIAWVNEDEIEALAASLRGGWDSKFEASSEPPMFRSAYIPPNSPDGIAGQPSVRLYRLKMGK